MSSGFKAGVLSLGDEIDAALTCLGDMPQVRPAHPHAEQVCEVLSEDDRF